PPPASGEVLIELEGDLVVASFDRFGIERSRPELDLLHAAVRSQHRERPDRRLLPPPARGHARSSSCTSSRSSNSSFVVTLIFPRAHSSCSRPSTTDQAAPSLRTGKPNWRPSGMPYSPRLATASECQSPSGVGFTTLRTESRSACAADAAEDAPRLSITAAPRFWTIPRNGPRSQA